MATKIQLTTELLRSQEATMRRLYEEQQSYNTRITSAINKMNDGLTNALRHNISSKANTVISQASSTAETLNWGADAIEKVIAAYEGVEGTLKNLIEQFFGSIGSQKNGAKNNDGGSEFTSVSNFQDYAQKQALSSNCTSTAWCMGLSMITGEKYDATSWPFWNDGARYVDINGLGAYKEPPFDSSDVWGKMYDQINMGKPVMFTATNGNSISGTHSVTVVGVANGTDRASVSQNDFLVIDPTDGCVKKLSEVGYTTYSGCWINCYK